MTKASSSSSASSAGAASSAASAGAPPADTAAMVTGTCAVVDEYLAILCAVKAWRDDPRQAAFPHELRERIDAVAATVATGAA